MKLGFTQPYFFPYLGYFELIKKVDIWIGFDTVNFSPRSWMTRNRILHPISGWQYTRVRVEHASRNKPLLSIQLSHPEEDCELIIRQLTHYKNKAPYYKEVVDIIRTTFASRSDNLLVSVNEESLKTVCTYLGIPFSPKRFSQMNMQLEKVTKPGHWALFVAQQLGATSYYNAPGGTEIYNADEYASRGIALHFVELPTLTYSCADFKFEPYLSILDVLMWLSPQEIQDYFAKKGKC